MPGPRGTLNTLPTPRSSAMPVPGYHGCWCSETKRIVSIGLHQRLGPVAVVDVPVHDEHPGAPGASARAAPRRSRCSPGRTPSPCLPARDAPAAARPRTRAPARRGRGPRPRARRPSRRAPHSSSPRSGWCRGTAPRRPARSGTPGCGGSESGWTTRSGSRDAGFASVIATPGVAFALSSRTRRRAGRLGVVRSGIVPEAVGMREDGDGHQPLRTRRSSSASSRRSRRASSISSSRRRCRRQNRSTPPDETKSTRPATSSTRFPAQTPSPSSAAPSNARNPAATRVRERKASGESATVKRLSNRAAPTRQDDHGAVGHEPGVGERARLVVQLGATELEHVFVGIAGDLGRRRGRGA